MAFVSVRAFCPISRIILASSSFATSAVTSDSKTTDETKSDADEKDEANESYRLSEEELTRARNISGLPPHMRQRMKHVDGIVDLDDFTWKKSRYGKAKLFGRYGSRTNIDPSVVWPVKEEIERLKEYERDWERSLDQLKADVAAKEAAEKAEIDKHQKTVLANMKKMPQLIKQYEAKIAVKEKKIRQAAEERERLLEEARELFGRRVRLDSPEFQELVERKQLEEKKKLKEAKKAKKMQKLAAALGIAQQSDAEQS